MRAVPLLKTESADMISHSTFHAFFLAANESGFSEFRLQLINPKGPLEFCISPQGHPEMTAKFEVRGNTVRAAEGGNIPADTSVYEEINFGGTRSGEIPVWAL